MEHDAAHVAVRESLSAGRILLATCGSGLVALVLLVTVVAPAEYGYDPTGIGHKLGLDALHNTVPTASVLWDAQSARRNDSASVTLGPGEGVEVKAEMTEGQQLLFSWRAEGGPLFLELHGDHHDKDIPYSSYKTLPSVTRGEGGLTAPFDGLHGWYWRNDNDHDVVVTVDTIGYYALLKTQ